MSSSVDANEVQFKQIFQTLQSKPQGYMGTAEFLYDLFNGHTVDGEITAKRNGFKTFPQFLKSDFMKKYVELGATNDGRTVYKPRQILKSERTLCESEKSAQVLYVLYYRQSFSNCLPSVQLTSNFNQLSSVVTKKMGTETTLTINDLQKLGEVIEAIVQYHFPDHVQLKKLLPAIEMVEPRFSSLEQNANISHIAFLRRYCTNVSLFGSSNNPSLLWKENRN
ncbi:hypothetical protein DdX_08716 [Ditylenchus destructor]|uniref:DUF7515 domain-containing protein n=1 Tax=Ditylenchus destructor TaxID=166010 RepID=A0AAD4N6W4_9BILA|nr:hypothetical protein DdX_08716 [Ditylenchus destructor]